MIFTTGTLAVIMLSCDVMQSDPDLKKPAVVTASKVYALSTGSTFIDLNSVLQVNQPVTITVTSQTRSGTLTNLSSGLFQYAPNAGKSGTMDAFRYTVNNQNNGILSQDSLVIVISDSSQLPCGLYPVDDYVYSIPRITPTQYQTVFIDVLANDILCDYDSSDVELSVYNPGLGYGPHNGNAGAVYEGLSLGHGASGFGINYTPNSTFNGTDQFIYKIQFRSIPARVAFGIVYIATSDACAFTLVDDAYHIGHDSITQVESGFLFGVFNNDVLCDSLSLYQYHIADGPHEGSATIDSNGIRYTTNAMSPGQTRVDTIRYEVCRPSKCLKAKVLFYLQN